MSATTSAMAPQPMRPARKARHADLVAGVEPGRGEAAGPARLFGEVEADEDLAVGGLEVESAQRRPVDGTEGVRRGDGGNRARTRWAVACLAGKVGPRSIRQ